MTDVVERAEAWMRDVHTGSAAEIIPDLLDELGRLRESGDRLAAVIDECASVIESAEAERDELRATIERVRAYLPGAAGAGH